MSSKNEKATLCHNEDCVTVYGETAEIVNTLFIVAALLILAGVVAKALS